MCNLNNIKISNIITDLNGNGIKPTSHNLEEVLEMLIPRDDSGNLLSNYSVKEQTLFQARPGFNPKFNNLIFSGNGMEKWCEEYCKTFLGDNYTSKANYLEFYNYIYYAIILHELEHCKQFVQALNGYSCRCDIMPIVYKEILNVLVRNTSSWKSVIPFYDSIDIIRHFLYKKNEYKLLLERNACVFEFDNIIKIMEINQGVSEETMEMFCSLYVASLLIGYEVKENKVDYPIAHTLRTLYKKRIINQLDFSSTLSLIEQMNYGMPIDKDLIKEIISYTKENSNDFIKVKTKIYSILK